MEMSRLLSCLLLHTSTHKEARTNLFMHNFYKLNYWLTGIRRTVLFHTLIVQSTFYHTHTVPEGSGKGTLGAVNGVKATEYLCRAERLTPHSQPFSWVLFRPPWAPNHLCYKACVCSQMEQLCKNTSSKVC